MADDAAEAMAVSPRETTGDDEGAAREREQPREEPEEAMPTNLLRFAMVCASNQNRSMEAHRVLKERGFTVRGDPGDGCGGERPEGPHAGLTRGTHDHQVDSYGVGQHVKLPGPSAREPNVYPFGTPYQQIYDELKAKDAPLYTRNGLLTMLERNAKIKRAPERWQDHDMEDVSRAPDVALCFEERVFETLVEDMAQREQTSMRPLLVVNLDVIDSHEEAATAAPLALKLCGMLDALGEDWEEELDSVVNAFFKDTGRRLLYTVCFL